MRLPAWILVLATLSLTGCDRWLKGFGIDGDWTAQPSRPPAGTTPPQYKWEAGTHFWRIGQDGNTPGSPGSSISTRFRCGEGHHPFCTIKMAIILTLRDGEQASVEVAQGGVGLKRALLPHGGPGAPISLELSVPGCAGEFDISFALTGGQTGNVQSTLDVNGVTANCENTDTTNRRAERGQELRDPETNEPLRPRSP